MSSEESLDSVVAREVEKLRPRKVELERQYNEIANEYGRINALLFALESYLKSTEATKE